MKALVVDDDSISRMVLVHLLSSLGIFDVAEADDGQAAWEMLQAGLTPDICFCDGRMPRLTGLGLLQRLKEQNSAYFPFILVSASDEKESVEQATELGAAGYIVKPFEIDDVRAQLDKHFKHSWMHVAENPAASVRRLKIQLAQLLGYLQAFQTQLDNAVTEFDATDCAASSIKQRLSTLQHACLTLGLSYAAKLLGTANTEPVDKLKLMQVMRTVQIAVQHQIGVVKAMPSAPRAG